MFIPNKTFSAIQTGVVVLIAALLAIIAWQTVDLTLTEKSNEAQVDSIQAVLDTQAVETEGEFRSAARRQDLSDERFDNLEKIVMQQGQSLTEFQGSLLATRTSVEKLLRNECTPETAIYVLTRDMVAVCRSLGTVPPQ